MIEKDVHDLQKQVEDLRSMVCYLTGVTPEGKKVPHLSYCYCNKLLSDGFKAPKNKCNCGATLINDALGLY